MSDLDSVVIRFSGDSGDGMQLTGTQFSSTSAFMGNDIATFPDFPAEIRAPAGTVAGVSGFQINFGRVTINTPGDSPDVLIAMNPAALKANLDDLKLGGTVIINKDLFNDSGYKKAGYTTCPLTDGTLQEYKVIEVPMTTQTKEALKDLDLDAKSKSRCKNFYALGMTYFIYSRSLDPTIEWIADKFSKNSTLVQANQLALKAGHHFADTLELVGGNHQVQAADIEAGVYRQINGNTALAWGFIAGAQKAGLELFLGSYPITPASDVLHELAKHKKYGVKTFQAEDEIAAVCSAIGASFGGGLAITTSSGPGIALKSEGLNLAIMFELPLVVIDIQRGGPSTGLPTKTEQSDLNMALYGRNGEAPCIVLAPCSPSDCFEMAFEAARLSLEHMTPVMLLSDGYIANSTTPWKIPDIKKYPKIKTRLATQKDLDGDVFYPYKRDAEHVRPWAIPGMEGFEHRLGGLEKQELTGNVSYDPNNHEKMVHIRKEKVDYVADHIPQQEVIGPEKGKLLLVSWGGTYGATMSAVNELRQEGIDVSLMHIRYLNPLPRNVETILRSFEQVLVCELNNGQLKNYLNSLFNIKATGYNKIKGRPFMIREIKALVQSKFEVGA
jgi:2-oxoglutarate ferredoxin oxidoreductase subunit alpha